MARIKCRFCETVTDGVLVTPTLNNFLKEKFPKAFVVYCRGCGKEYLLERRSHKLMGTVKDVTPMNPMEPQRTAVFVAENGELIVGAERAI